MSTASASASHPSSAPDPSTAEVRQRSVGELLQLLGATRPSEVKVQQVDAAGTSSPLSVHPNTDQQLNWKPEFYARRGDGSRKLAITRMESESLLNAGAASVIP